MQEHDSFEKLSKKIYFFLETFSRLRKHKDKIVSFQLDFFLFDGPHHARNAIYAPKFLPPFSKVKFFFRVSDFSPFSSKSIPVLFYCSFAVPP